MSARAVQGEGRTAFEKNSEQQRKDNEVPWALFESVEEWELAKWLLTSGLSQRAVDDFLRLRIVSTHQSEVRRRLGSPDS